MSTSTITLPPFIMKAIEAKMAREQEAGKQKAELDRYRTGQRKTCFLNGESPQPLPLMNIGDVLQTGK